MSLGWGVSGTGDIINKAVAPAILEQPDSDLVAFYSRTAARGAQFAEQFGAPRSYDSLAAMLGDPELQAVYVGGEVDRHAPETIAAAEAGKHVLCEKPMALDAAECRAMIDACAANGVGLAIAYYRRYYPQTLKLKELLDARAIGRPLQCAVDMASAYRPKPDDPKYWRVAEGGGGGALMDIGSHRLDVVCWLLGAPQKVAGFADTLHQPYRAPDTETLVARLASGCHLTCRCTWAAGGRQDELRIFGTTGALICGALEARQIVLSRSGQPDEVIEVGPVASNRHLPLIDDFTTRILSGQMPRHDGTAGYQASRIMDGCYRSARTGQVVDV